MESMCEPKKIAVNFEPALLAALDEHRRQLPDLPNRSEAIRRLVAAVASNGASIEESRGQKASRKVSAR
jgi:hypothetical protein